MAEQDEITIGEIGRTVHRIEANMVTKDANGAVIQGLIEADKRNADAIKEMADQLRAENKATAGALTLALEEQEKIKEKQEARRYDLVKAIGISLLVAVLGVISSLVIILLRGTGSSG